MRLSQRGETSGRVDARTGARSCSDTSSRTRVRQLDERPFPLGRACGVRWRRIRAARPTNGSELGRRCPRSVSARSRPVLLQAMGRREHEEGRQYVAETARRMEIPPIVLHLYRMNQKRPETRRRQHFVGVKLER
jgi:hypothetical protein